MTNTGFGCDLEKDTSRIFELEQRCAALEEQADLDTIRMSRLAESNQKLKDLNREMFVSRCQAHISAEAAEQDAARFRMLLQQNKHWLGVFACNPDGTPSDSLDHAELKARLDSLIAQEPAPGCKTPSGCHENGCLGWCDEHEPPTRSQKMRVAGYTRRPSAKSLPSDE